MPTNLARSDRIGCIVAARGAPTTRIAVRVILRFGAIAFVLLAATIVAISPFASAFIEQWSRRDVELRSTLVFNSVRDELANLLAVDAGARIDNLFARLAFDERLYAVG